TRRSTHAASATDGSQRRRRRRRRRLRGNRAMSQTPHPPAPSPSRGEGEHPVSPHPRTRRGVLHTPAGGEGSPWRMVPLDAVVLSLSLLGALVRPPDASATLIAVAATFLLGLYWAVALFRRHGEGDYAGRAFRVQLAIVLA